MALSFALPCNSKKTSLQVVFGSVSASPCGTDVPRLVNLARSSAGTAFPKLQEVAEGDPSAFPAHMVVADPKESFWRSSLTFVTLHGGTWATHA